MPPSKRSLQNLKRGGIQGTPESAARARAAKAVHAAEDARLADVSRTDPEAAVLELHADLTVGVRRLLRSWLTQGGNPPRVLIEGMREFRQASRDAIEYLRLRGNDGAAGAFLDKVEERLANANFGTCANCGEPVRHPYVEKQEAKR